MRKYKTAIAVCSLTCGCLLLSSNSYAASAFEVPGPGLKPDVVTIYGYKDTVPNSASTTRSISTGDQGVVRTVNRAGAFTRSKQDRHSTVNPSSGRGGKK